MKPKLILAILAVVSLLVATAWAGADQPSDDQIYDNVRRKLANDPDVKGGAFEVEVKQGVVTIRGAVETEKQKDRANKVAKKVKGVKQVVNELRITRK